ncbi:MAG: gamma-glutamyl-gamma-aminobutyrate hydrolase family protein, partial [Firmicutes bacterium]|nr:gamma-glutamyl-gamma-aminobutyrate hydrolase family protein [Bacillota bacterium]
RWSRLGVDYTGGVEEAGGLPVIVAIPGRVREAPDREAAAHAERWAREVLAAVDGLLVTGGGDLDPAHFGEGPHANLGELEPARDHFELALVREALASGAPVFGICRGLQVLAVAAGGDLYQDLPSQVPGVLKHRQSAPRTARTHLVEVREGTLLARLLGGPGPLSVNSFHHQAVRRVPDGFRVSATAPDGVVEALESTGPGLAFGVQWHPENLWARDPVFLGLFRGLVDEASARRERRRHGGRAPAGEGLLEGARVLEGGR